ncbi:hypothetical protein ABIE56_001802 [Luteibacter sp. 621]|uniref:hypothetical protein n=1 Tax=Luteibacter sp. 621 TaxID=3373916 RepID=UPI003D1D88E1
MTAWHRSRAAYGTFATLVFVVALFVNGAIPGVTVPTLGQALWTASFAQSFANSGLFSIYAHNFGAPMPAAISFGLAGALPCAWLIGVGMKPLVAYTAMFALWLAIAYVGAIASCWRLGTRGWLACALAGLWLCLPIVYMHAGYSMLGLGIALLPAYMWAIAGLLDRPTLRAAAVLVAATLISAFMDGYTFVMFAAGAAVLSLGKLWDTRRLPDVRRRLLTVAAPAVVISFGGAAALYRLYVHGGHYDTAPLAMFRAWGMDITFAWLPTSGEFWLWDVLGIGQLRDEATMYGDRSVWITTFAAPLLIFACYAAWRTRKHTLTRWIVLIAMASLFLSLGPSLKVNSHKPPDVSDPLMPSHAAVTRTHTAYLTTHLPAIRMMRAPYRWAALGYCACWMLVVIYCSRRREGTRWSDTVLVLALVVMVFPHPREKWHEGLAYRRMADAIDVDWVGGMRHAGLGPTVAFVPVGNDFLAGYAAARLGIRTYNVGGDKNVGQAVAEWPTAMTNLGDPVRPEFTDLATFFLLDGTGDQIIVPYVDLLRSALNWPCFDGASIPAHRQVSTACIETQRAHYAAALVDVSKSPYLSVVDGPLFATISLKPAFRDPDARKQARTADIAAISYPVVIASQLHAARFMLTSGWNPEEPGVRWSQAKARISLPVPAACKGQPCKVSLGFGAFAASPERPVTLAARSLDRPGISATTTVRDLANHELSLTVPGDRDLLDIALDIPEATSPAALGLSVDGRVIGIDLRVIDVHP